jgi:hypothetical protein
LTNDNQWRKNKEAGAGGKMLPCILLCLHFGMMFTEDSGMMVNEE